MSQIGMVRSSLVSDRMTLLAKREVGKKTFETRKWYKTNEFYIVASGTQEFTEDNKVVSKGELSFFFNWLNNKTEIYKSLKNLIKDLIGKKIRGGEE